MFPVLHSFVTDVEIDDYALKAERVGVRERLLEENLIFKGLHFQNTNRSDCEFYKTFMELSEITYSPRTLGT